MQNPFSDGIRRNARQYLFELYIKILHRLNAPKEWSFFGKRKKKNAMLAKGNKGAFENIDRYPHQKRICFQWKASIIYRWSSTASNRLLAFSDTQCPPADRFSTSLDPPFDSYCDPSDASANAWIETRHLHRITTAGVFDRLSVLRVVRCQISIATSYRAAWIDPAERSTNINLRSPDYRSIHHVVTSINSPRRNWIAN